MVMIFTLVTAVQEKLNEIVDQIKTRREEEKKQKEKEAEEAEKQLFHGTPVTIENFLNWKAKFDAELLEITGGQGSFSYLPVMTSDDVIQFRDHRTAGQSDLTDSVMYGTLEGETTGLSSQTHH